MPVNHVKRFYLFVHLFVGCLISWLVGCLVEKMMSGWLFGCVFFSETENTTQTKHVGPYSQTMFKANH